MGVRHFPQTDDKRLTEILADVPRGTYERLEKFEKENPVDPMDQEQGYEVYKLRQADPDIDRLHNFILFGYGRVRHDQMSQLGFDPNGGTTRSLIEMGRILGLHLETDQVKRIFPHLYRLDALSWC